LRDSPGSRFAIRRGVPADLPRLAEIETQAFDSDRLSRRSLARHVGSPGAALLVAEDGEGTLAAYALVLFRRLSSIARLYSVAVDESAKGRGLARRLIAAAEAEATRRGKTAIRLEVRVDNAGAIRLYERAGYTPFGRYRDYYQDHADALRYEKALGA
jgi:[ribosomal protein S18]-alanine N-acetyltransferase